MSNYDPNQQNNPPPAPQPTYSAPPPPQQTVVVAQKKKRPTWLTLLLGLIGACLVLGVIGSLLNKPTTTISPVAVAPTRTVAAVAASQSTQASAATQPVAQATEAPKPTDTAAAAPVAQALGVGGTGTAGGLKVTLNSVRHETKGLVDAKAGMEYLIVNLTIENAGNDPASVSSIMSFSVKDDTGQKYSQAFGANIKSGAEGSIAPNDKVRGETAFEVPTTANGLTFTFDPILGSDPIKFKLDR